MDGSRENYLEIVMDRLRGRL